MSHGEVKQINGKRVASPEYRSWQMMKNRCLNPNAADWAYYGGRGITMDLRWLEFDEFLGDVGRKPAPGLTIERKDSNGHYEKGNCFWATREQQARNRSYVKLSMEKAGAIRAAYTPGVTRQIDLAKQFGVCQRTISLVVRGEYWREEAVA